MTSLTRIAKGLKNMAPVCVAALSLSACVDSAGGASALYEMNESSARPVAEITDFASAERYAQANSYYDGSLCQSYLKGGESVAFSASYETEGEAGQAYGEIKREGNQFFYHQLGQPTTQAMLAPGSAGWEGKSLWEFGRYLRTVCSVVFGKGRMGPDYTGIKAEIISMTGGTAGKTVAYNDALKLSLNKSVAGGRTDLVVVLAKGVGPRVVEFREDNMPAGTAKVYIGGSGGASEVAGGGDGGFRDPLL